MQKKVSCIIADDNEIDRLTTLSFVRKYSFLKIDGVFSSADKVLEAMNTLHPEILFLDIDMPGMSGLELREKLMHVACCIFITSYPDYAAESFDKSALDFLVKPLKADRFERSMVRLEEFLVVRDKAALLDETIGADHIFIKEGHERIKINMRDVLYLEALKDYTRIVTEAKKYCVLSPLGNLLKEEPFRSFIRIHRSFAIQKNYLSRVTSNSVVINNIELPVGRVYKEALGKLK